MKGEREARKKEESQGTEFVPAASSLAQREKCRRKEEINFRVINIYDLI